MKKLWNRLVHAVTYELLSTWAEWHYFVSGIAIGFTLGVILGLLLGKI